MCGGNSKILHQLPCASLDIDGGIEEEQRLVGVTALQHVSDLPSHPITCVDTQDNTICITRKHGDGLLPMSIVHIQALCTQGECLAAPSRSCGLPMAIRSPRPSRRSSISSSRVAGARPRSN